MVKIKELKTKVPHKKIKQYIGLCSGACQSIADSFHKTLLNIGKKLAKKGIKANFITLVGFIIGLLAINFLAIESYGWALVCILLNRICDILDGAVAKNDKVTDFGVFFDATLDYIFYAGIIFGFALANPQNNAVAATFLMFGFISSACALLAYAIVAYQEKKARPHFNESPFYLGGLAQGFETFVALVVLCIMPKLFLPLSIILGIFCFVKAVSVVASAYYVFVISNKKEKE